MTRPLVSVILPVYNGSLYLREAVSSILTQDLSDIELIVINDASSDESDLVLKEFTDKRIIHITNAINIGLASTLNLGIAEAKGKFIARMDQDDIAQPQRLRLQAKAFLDDDNLGLCGSNFQAFGPHGVQTSDYPTNHDKIFTNLLFYNCIAHPTVMFKKEVFKKNGLFYDKEFDWAEDLDLWTKARHVTKFVNLNRPLLRYRINNTSMMASGFSKVHNTVNAINKRSLMELGINASNTILDLHLKIGHHLINPLDEIQTKDTGDHLWNIILHNRDVKVYNEHDLKEAIATFWHPLLLNIPEHSRIELLNLEISNFLNSSKILQWKLRGQILKNRLKMMLGK
ncbi:MAG: glycosyltransferase family 2 protein [Opitutaceae bacterium]|nr:glycosyltransferase family 2 protein [Cytophagales bacterium]